MLGAGIMGASLALYLARRGGEITLFDREDAPMSCASRWNEGKIHLGYLYGADPTLKTARRLVPGGLAFGRLVSELIETDVAPHMTEGDDLYLVHPNSVVDTETLAGRFEAIDALVREHTDADRSAALFRSARLSAQALARVADSNEIRGGSECPSVR